MPRAKPLPVKRSAAVAALHEVNAHSLSWWRRRLLARWIPPYNAHPTLIRVRLPPDPRVMTHKQVVHADAGGQRDDLFVFRRIEGRFSP